MVKGRNEKLKFGICYRLEFNAKCLHESDHPKGEIINQFISPFAGIEKEEP